jgi:hypothetical protein
MRPTPDQESSTQTNTPAPQLRKKRIKRMKSKNEGLITGERRNSVVDVK